MGELEHRPDGAKNFHFPDSEVKEKKTEVDSQKTQEAVVKIADLFEQGKIKYTDIYMEHEGGGDQEARKVIEEIHELFGWDSEKIADLEPLVKKELEKRALEKFMRDNIDNIAEFAFSHSSRLKVGESAGKDTMKKKPFSRDGLLTLVSEMSGTPNEIKVSIQTVSEESIVSWAEEIKRKMDSMDDVGF